MFTRKSQARSHTHIWLIKLFTINWTTKQRKKRTLNGRKHSGGSEIHRQRARCGKRDSFTSWNAPSAQSSEGSRDKGTKIIAVAQCQIVLENSSPRSANINERWNMALTRKFNYSTDRGAKRFRQLLDQISYRRPWTAIKTVYLRSVELATFDVDLFSSPKLDRAKRASASSDGLNEEVGGKLGAVLLFADHDLWSRRTKKTRLNPKSVLRTKKSLFRCFKAFWMESVEWNLAAGTLRGFVVN